MKRKLIALFAACSMITTAVAGLVQTAYADNDPVTIVVSDGATDTEKVLTFYYETDDLQMFEGYLSLDNGATINSANVTIAYAAGMGDKNAAAYNDTEWQIMVTSYDQPMTTGDKSFATATVTVPTDKDVTVSFRIEYMADGNWVDVGQPTISVTIPKKAAPPVPSVDTSVENSAVFTEADGYDKNVVVGTIQLDVVNTTIDLTKAEYEGKNPTKVEGYDNPTQFSGSALITVVINGATSEAELDKVVFN